MEPGQTAVVMAEVTDPEEIAKTRSRRESFDRNSGWLQRNVPEVYCKHRGKCICVAGEEVFVADTAKDRLGSVFGTCGLGLAGYRNIAGGCTGPGAGRDRPASITRLASSIRG